MFFGSRACRGSSGGPIATVDAQGEHYQQNIHNFNDPACSSASMQIIHTIFPVTGNSLGGSDYITRLSERSNNSYHKTDTNATEYSGETCLEHDRQLANYCWDENADTFLVIASVIGTSRNRKV